MDLIAIQRAAEEFSLGDVKWFNFWHTHVDWEGAGNDDLAIRKACAEALQTIYCRVQEELSDALNCQVWLSFPMDDAGQDAVYIHSPNPHSKFPFEFPEVTWGVEPPEFLQGVFDLQANELGLITLENSKSYWVRPRIGTANKTSLPTPDLPRVPPIMNVPSSTPSSNSAPCQA